MPLVSVDYFRTLFDYTYWARDRIMAAAAGISEPDYLYHRGMDHGSIHATLVHALASEVLFRDRWRGLHTWLTEEDLPGIEALRRRWTLEEATTRGFLAGLTDGDLATEVVYTTRSGVRQSEPLWQTLTQIVSHQTQHRSEVAWVLTQLGRSPGFLDFLGFTRETRPQA